MGVPPPECLVWLVKQFQILVVYSACLGGYRRVPKADRVSLRVSGDGSGQKPRPLLKHIAHKICISLSHPHVVLVVASHTCVLLIILLTPVWNGAERLARHVVHAYLHSHGPCCGSRFEGRLECVRCLVCGIRGRSHWRRVVTAGGT